MKDPRVQARFKRSRHNTVSFFIFNRDHYELSNKTIRANGNIYHTFKPNIFRDVQNLYQDEASTDMTLNEFNYSTNTSWDRKHQPVVEIGAELTGGVEDPMY